MQEQGFPGEDEGESNEMPKAPKGIFVLKFFEVDGQQLNDGQKARAKPFRELAHQIADWLPEGTARTTILERLLDIRDTCVKKFR